MAEALLNILILDLSIRAPKMVVINMQQIEHEMHGIVLGEEQSAQIKLPLFL